MSCDPGLYSNRFSAQLNIDRIYHLLVATHTDFYDFSGESHGCAFELICSLSGNLFVTSGPDIYECAPYELILVPPDVFHAYRSKDERGISLLNITFNGTNVDRHVPSGKFILTKHEKALVDILADEIKRSQAAPGLDSDDTKGESGQIIKNLLEALCLSLNQRRNESAVPQPERNALIFGEVVDYLQKNVDRSLSSNTICSDCGLGSTTLKMIFRTYTGAGVMKYYNRLRARRAAELIDNGIPLHQIVQIMNFSSQNYFSTFFCRETGQLPSKYRNDKKDLK